MRFTKSIFATLIMFGLLLSLSACGSKPVTFADLPAHPDAVPMERGTNSVADTVAASLESSLSERGKVELKLYSMPGTISWEEVDGFYEESLKESDWKAVADLRQESSIINTVGWTRGSFASEQGLVVGYAPNIVDDGAFLIVALFSE